MYRYIKAVMIISALPFIAIGLMFMGIRIYWANQKNFGPILSWTDDPRTTITISWFTDAPMDSVVEYWEEGGTHNWKNVSTATTHHGITLTGLSPGTVYYYRILSSQGNLPGKMSNIYSFRTAPDGNATYMFVYYADSRMDMFMSSEHPEIAEKIAKENASFVLHGGDMVMIGGQVEEWHMFLAAAELYATNKSLMTTAGNHEGYSDETFSNYKRFLALPSSELWYSFDYGNVHYVSAYLPWEDQAHVNQEFKEWLANDLSSTNATWKIVFFHVPPFSPGPCQNDSAIDREIWPILKENNVSLVLTSHEHFYARGKIDGIPLVISGGGGAELDPRPASTSWMPVTATGYHYLRVYVNPSMISVEAVSLQGSIIDAFNITI